MPRFWECWVPALLPHFIGLWELTNSQAGWISGIYFVGMMANIGFAFFSQGFWSALIFRGLCGIGLAGTFIPGLKALIDRLDIRFLPRAISFYTACFGLCMSLSFYYAGMIFKWFGWKAVYFIAAASSGLVLVLCLMILQPSMPVSSLRQIRIAGVPPWRFSLWQDLPPHPCLPLLWGLFWTEQLN